MKNLQIIKQQRGDISISKDIDTIREVFQTGAYLLSGDDIGYDLDETHKLKKGENALIIITQWNHKKHSLVICSQGAFFDDEKVWDIEDGAITEPKLDTSLKTKVNNNVKTVAQTLSDDAVRIASKNLKFRDGSGNFFADYYSYNNAISKTSQTPSYSIFGGNCYGNKFDNAASNIFGNKFESNEFSTNCIGNIFGNRCSFNIASYSFYHNIIGNNCNRNTFGTSCESNTIGNEVSNNMFGNFLTFCKVDNGVSFIELKSNATSTRPLKNIHILSGVRGKSKTERLVINIPDEYLNSSRELIITTKRTDGGPSTPEDIVMYYADEVVDKQNKQDNTLATTSKEVVGAINELFNGAVQKSALSPVPLTVTTSTNKTQLDLFLSKVPNAQVMHVTYKDVYAGTLHKINGSWYGVLVGESNTLAGQLSIKLQADGTIVEGTA